MRQDKRIHVNVKNELTNALGAALTYDANGNATGLGGGVTCAYDDENRLIQRLYYQYSWMHATNGDQRTDLVYDGQGRLRKRLEYTIPAIQPGTNPPPDSLTLELGVMGLPAQPNWTLESETWYVYEGKRVIQERNGSNVPQVSYTRGTDLSGSLEGAGGIGGLLARSEGITQASYFADGNGNITSLSGGNLAVVASYRYDAYGNLLFKSGAWADTNVYRFSSKECHVKSGLYYYLYRWYSPELQRWITRDPMGEPGFAVVASPIPVEWGIQANLYACVLNDPVSRFDALGLTDGDTATERCKERCFKWAESVQEAGFDGRKAYYDCDMGCDLDPNYVPGSPLPPLPTMKPKEPKSGWSAVFEIVKTAKECWKEFRKPKE